MRHLWLLCLLVVARAEDRRPLLPTRAVTVHYRATAAGHTTNLRVLYSAASQGLRAEALGQSTYLIVDGSAKTAHPRPIR